MSRLHEHLTGKVKEEKNKKSKHNDNEKQFKLFEEIFVDKKKS